MYCSIVILTYNQLEDGTKPCIESIYLNTDISKFELIIIDNCSSDGTQEYLKSIEGKYSNLKILLNDINKGYSGGNNDGIRLAQGDYIILMNNDVLVTENWLERLLSPFNTDANIGLIGPISNSVGNEQLVELSGLTESNYKTYTKRYTDRNKDIIFETSKLGFFCVAISKDVIKKVGFLDERFGIGMFEDDDYCMRVKKAGYKIIVNESCFIYHKGSLSFSKLDSDKYHEIFNRNKDLFFEKHNVQWTMSDLIFSYLEKFKEDLNKYTSKNKDIDPNIERIIVRLSSMKKIMYQIRNIEIKKMNLNPENTLQSKNLSKIKWESRMSDMKNQLLVGNYRQKINYLRRVKNKLFPQEKYKSIINKFGKIRRRTDFKKVIIFPATVDFSYMQQRPQQLAKAFAKEGYLVIYGTLNFQTDNVLIIKKVNKHLYILNEKYFPLLNHLATKAETIYYCMWPNNIKHLEYLNYCTLIYDYMDEISLLNLPIDELEKDHLRLIKEANLITVSAKKLLEQINLEYQTKAILINNAVSEEFIINLKNAKINKEINKSKNEGKKVIGYYGAIAEWLDFDLVNYLAENCKECDFIFIGPVFNTENEIKKLQENSPNIKFIKQIPHEKLLSYLKGFDICIIPFIKNELTDSVSPVKLFEYMANNKPIICTDLAECRNYKSVNIAENKDEFLEKIKENLIEGSNKKINKIEAKELDENTWESRVKTIVKHIK